MRGLESNTGYTAAPVLSFFEELNALYSLMKWNNLGLADKIREMLGTGSAAAEAEQKPKTPAIEEEKTPDIDGCRWELRRLLGVRGDLDEVSYDLMKRPRTISVK